jgi:hypothetical protein
MTERCPLQYADASILQGTGWTGLAVCNPPYTCTVQNTWYSQVSLYLTSKDSHTHSRAVPLKIETVLTPRRIKFNLMQVLIKWVVN